MTAPGFNGSYLRALDRIRARAVMNGRVCRTPRDPAQGDVAWRIDPGTLLLARPGREAPFPGPEDQGRAAAVPSRRRQIAGGLWG